MAHSKESTYQCRRGGIQFGKISQRKKWQPAPVYLHGKLHGQRRLAGYSPWGPKELDTTEWLSTRATLLDLKDNGWEGRWHSSAYVLPVTTDTNAYADQPQGMSQASSIRATGWQWQLKKMVRTEQEGRASLWKQRDLRKSWRWGFWGCVWACSFKSQQIKHYFCVCVCVSHLLKSLLT